MGHIQLKIRQLFLLPILVSIFNSSFARQSDSSGFKNDFRILRKALEETHPDLYRFTSKERFDITFDSIDLQIKSSTSPLDYFRLLSRIESLVREGHTYLHLSANVLQQLKHQKIFPFQVIIDEHTLTIAKSSDTKNKIYEGAEVESINGKTIKEIITKIENATGLKSGYNNSALLHTLSFDNNFALAYYLFIDTTREFNVQFKGNSESMHIEGINDSQIESFPKSPKESSPPTHLQIDSTNKTAVLKITTFAYWMVSSSKRKHIKTFNKYFIEIEKTGVKNLIIDVRNNRGGEELLAAELLTYLISSEFRIYKYMKAKTLTFNYHLPNATHFRFSEKDYVKTDSGYFKIKDEVLATFLPKKHNHFNGKVFILANGGSRSASSIMLALIRTHKAGVIIGQESGGAYEDVDGRKRVNFTLPHSGIEVSFPAWSFKIDSSNGANRLRGVLPDYTTERIDTDKLPGKDAELEMAYKLISKQ